MNVTDTEMDRSKESMLEWEWWLLTYKTEKKVLDKIKQIQAQYEETLVTGTIEEKEISYLAMSNDIYMLGKVLKYMQEMKELTVLPFEPNLGWFIDSILKHKDINFKTRIVGVTGMIGGKVFIAKTKKLKTKIHRTIPNGHPCIQMAKLIYELNYLIRGKEMAFYGGYFQVNENGTILIRYATI